MCVCVCMYVLGMVVDCEWVGLSCPIHSSIPQGGSTPLHLAAEKAKVAAVRTLLKYNPNTQLRDMVSA